MVVLGESSSHLILASLFPNAKLQWMTANATVIVTPPPLANPVEHEREPGELGLKPSILLRCLPVKS